MDTIRAYSTSSTLINEQRSGYWKQGGQGAMTGQIFGFCFELESMDDDDQASNAGGDTEAQGRGYALSAIVTGVLLVGTRRKHFKSLFLFSVLLTL